MMRVFAPIPAPWRHWLAVMLAIDWECYLLGLTGGIEPNDGANVWSVNGGSHRFNQPAKPGQPPIEGR